MSVFLRWGVFGILSVAALLYAYNASKRISQRSAPPAAQVASAEVATAEDGDADESPTDGAALNEADTEPEPPLPGQCALELQVAERALKMRRDGETLDRLMRIDRILFESDEKRRERLVTVARAWFEREGRDPDAAQLRDEVLRDCQRAAAVTPTGAP